MDKAEAIAKRPDNAMVEAAIAKKPGVRAEVKCQEAR